MSEWLVGALISLIIAAGGGVGFLIRRRDNRKDPIPKQTAALAASAQALEMMSGVAQQLRTDVTDLRSRFDQVQQEAATDRSRLEQRVESLEGSVEVLDTSLTAALRYIEHLIRYLRSGAHGPEPIVPPELADLIDPMLRHWGRPSGA